MRSLFAVMMSSGGLGGLDNLRKSKNGLYIGLAITALLSLLLLLFVNICFVYMAIALIMYGVPTYFGLKSKKKLAVFGLVLLLVLGLAWGAMFANNINTFTGEKVTASKYLSNGTVAPIHGVPDSTYQYEVSLSEGSIYKNVTLSYYDTQDTNSIKRVSMNTTNNLTYTASAVLGTSGIYAYYFSVWDGSETISTPIGTGPITASNGEIYGIYLQLCVFLAYLQIGLLFFMLLVLTWWMDRSKQRMQEQFNEAQAKRSAAAGEEKFVCSECGSDVPADAEKCPQCGERFDDAKETAKPATEDVKKCPKCGAAIFDTDKKCWNCGKILENKDQK
ncbi:MAG: Double zinc ribbon [Methanomassiliicoccales archaeon PtaU1.Bin124]|nr:MAG: Double zinc ribbon [Methanomassiliicoccales archaeon PtaU1.Bin124]